MMKIGRRTGSWLLAAGYTALIYSTLYVAPKFFLVLSRIFGPSLGRALSIAIALIPLVFFITFYRKVKSRSAAFYLALAAIAAIYAVILFRYTPIVAEKMHLVEYGFLSYLVLRALRQDVKSRFLKYAYAIMIVAAVGYCDELIQRFLPNRVYDIRDVALNAVSGILGLSLVTLLGYD